MDALTHFTQQLANTLWDTPLVALLLGSAKAIWQRPNGSPFPLDFYPRGHLRRYRKYRCGV